MPRLTRDQKIALYRDGYLVLKRVVPEALVSEARRTFNRRLGALRAEAAAGERLSRVKDVAASTFRAGDDTVYLDLFNRTPLKRSIEELFGAGVDDARGVQIAANYPSDPSDRVNEAGYYDRDTPFYGWCGHLDGLWNGAAGPPPIDIPLTAYQRRRWYGDPSTNGCRRCYPDHNANLQNFTALVGVALSDQRAVGVGNLGLLRGAHHEMGAFFREQAEAGGPIGPDGPGWPRENKAAPNGHGLNHYPDRLREVYRRGAATTADGQVWPKPTLVRLAPGDAVIVHFAVPHSSTRVEGPDPRIMCYFRASPNTRDGDNRIVYPEALVDIWREWRGMRSVVREQKRQRGGDRH